MTNQIDRAAVLELLETVAKGTIILGGQKYRTIQLEEIATAIRALPSAQVDEVERLTKDAAEWATLAADNSARAEAAEAKVAKLVDALREIAKEMHYPMGIGIDPVPTCAAKIARAALAEIKGDLK